MTLCLSPRYNLDDDSAWLLSIDPLRRYWIAVNGNENFAVGISGLFTAEMSVLRDTVLKFRDLNLGETLELATYSEPTRLHCVSANCYALVGQVNGAEVWHLLDRETLESLLMTAHPDWLPSPEDISRSQELLSRSWEKSLVA